jgi:hypothetical protein
MGVTASELIKKLAEAISVHGDLACTVEDGRCSSEADAVSVEFREKLDLVLPPRFYIAGDWQ